MKKELVDREGLLDHIRGRCISLQKAAGYYGSSWWANGIQECYTSADKAFLLRFPAVVVSGMLVSLSGIGPISNIENNEYVLISAPIATEWADYVENLISRKTLIKNGYSEEDGFYSIEKIKYQSSSFIEDTAQFYDIIQNELKDKPFPSNKNEYTKQNFTAKIVFSIANKLQTKYHWNSQGLYSSNNESEEHRYIVNKYGKGKEQIAGLMDFSCLQASIKVPFEGYTCYIKYINRNNEEGRIDCHPSNLIGLFQEQKKLIVSTRFKLNKYRRVQACVATPDNKETLISEASVDHGEELFFTQAHKLILEGRFWD